MSLHGPSGASITLDRIRARRRSLTGQCLRDEGVGSILRKPTPNVRDRELKCHTCGRGRALLYGLANGLMTLLTPESETPFAMTSPTTLEAPVSFTLRSLARMMPWTSDPPLSVTSY